MTTQHYYVRTGEREKGPFTLEQLREAVAQTAISTSAAVRADGETETRPLADVLRGHPAEGDPGSARPARRGASHAKRRADADLGNVYAPPRDDEPAPASLAGDLDQGDYWLGFGLGLFGGCIALVFTWSAKPQTRKGVVMGFSVGLAVGVLFRLFESGARR